MKITIYKLVHLVRCLYDRLLGSVLEGIEAPEIPTAIKGIQNFLFSRFFQGRNFCIIHYSVHVYIARMRANVVAFS